MKQPFTLVSTVFNEMRRLNQTIADIEAQVLKPDELVITDAGSKDGTYERLIEWSKESTISIKVLQKAKCNVAEGRNLAIAAASNNLIASTDFGCRFKPEWLKDLMAPFDTDPMLQVVGGGFSIIKEEVKNLPQKADYVLSNGYEIVFDEYFSTSSRSISYKKEVWEKIGGYPEWLTLAADDTIFWRQIKHHNFKYVFVPTPNVLWLRHKDYLGFGKESFRYGLGDGESRINFKNFISHIIETGLRYLFFAVLGYQLIFWLLGSHSFWSLFWALPFSPGLRSYKNAFARWQKFKTSEGYSFDVLLACFRMIEVTRRFYLKGYFKGYFKSTPKQKAEAIKLNTYIK